MTSANVLNIMQAQNQLTKVNKLSEEIGTGVDFSEMLNQKPDVNGYTFKASEVAKDVPVASSSVSYEKEQANTIAKQEKISTSDVSKMSDEEKAELGQTASKLDSEVKKAISEELEVSEEEVTKAMEALGLTAIDLLDTANLAKLMTELIGGEDVSAILLSGDFTQLKADITQIITDFANEMNMPIDDFSQVMTVLFDTEVVPEEIELPNLSEAGPIKGASDDAIASKVTDSLESAQITQHVSKTDSEGNVEVQETAADGKETVTVVSVAKEETTDEDTDSSDENNSDNGAKKTSMPKHEHTVINAQVEGNSFEVNPVFAEDAPLPSPQINAQELVDRLVEQTKANFNGGETSIEMILNPEELGKLVLKIVENKEGQMAASITVQNEDVKEALAQQMVLLKDSLNEQGVKIDAIEVTVSAHAFEENLENQFSNEENQGEQAEKQANARRNINLNDMDSLSGLMTEEEMLVAQMMADQGNTVNLTA